jgi:hypothetical protein
MTSLQKHVAFGAWFAAIAAGYAAAAMIRINKTKGWRVSAVVLGAVLILGIPQANGMFTWWPNTSVVTRQLSIVLDKSHCPCLLGQWNVASYYLPQQTADALLVSPYEFSYWDNTERRRLSGIPAYEMAIANGYFGVVEIDAAENPQIWTPVTQALARSGKYGLAAATPASHQSHPFEIWRRVKR